MTNHLGSNQKKGVVGVLTASFFCMTFLVSNSMAQEFTPANGVGSKALLFSFYGLANLAAGSFNGGVGGKYAMTEKLTVRGNFQFTTSSQSVPYNGAGTGTDGSASGTSFGLGVAGEYFLTKARLSPFIGAGILFSTTSTKQTNAVPTGTSQTTIENQAITLNGIPYTPGVGLNIFALAGVEFFITKEISLSVEYQLGYFLTSLSDRKDITGNTTTTTKQGSLSLLGIRSAGFITVGFYF